MSSSNSVGTVSVELYRVYELNLHNISIHLYKLFKSYELEYDSVDRLVEDEDLFLSWAMSVCSSENADLIKAVVELNGVTHGVVYSVDHGRSHDLRLPVPHLTIVKRVYLVYNSASASSGGVLIANNQDGGVVVYDLSSEQLYAFESPVKLVNKSTLRSIVVELQDSIVFLVVEGLRRVETHRRSRTKKRSRRRGRRRSR